MVLERVRLIPRLFVARLVEVFDALDADAEVILVDDGSRDRTYEVMFQATSGGSAVRLIRLSGNFGHRIALTAGVDLAAGDAVIVMEGDLQDPPEVILLPQELTVTLYGEFPSVSMPKPSAQCLLVRASACGKRGSEARSDFSTEPCS